MFLRPHLFFGHRDRQEIVQGAIWNRIHQRVSKPVGSGRNTKFANNSMFRVFPDAEKVDVDEFGIDVIGIGVDFAGIGFDFGGVGGNFGI